MASLKFLEGSRCHIHERETNPKVIEVLEETTKVMQRLTTTLNKQQQILDALVSHVAKMSPVPFDFTKS